MVYIIKILLNGMIKNEISYYNMYYADDDTEHFFDIASLHYQNGHQPM